MGDETYSESKEEAVFAGTPKWHYLTLVPVCGVLAIILSGMALGIIENTGVKLGQAGAIALIGVFFLLTSALFVVVTLKTGYWRLDEHHLYRGWKPSPLIPISEIMAVRRGVPEGRYLRFMGKSPTTARWLRQAISRSAAESIVLKLTNQRFFIWRGAGLENRDAFAERLCSIPGVQHGFELTEEESKKVVLSRRDRIIQI